MRENEKLLTDLDYMASAIAKEAGQNPAYGPCMDFSILPSVVKMTFTKAQIEENGTEIDGDTLTDLRLLARNGRVLPSFLKDATIERFGEYIMENRGRLLAEIRDICETHYKEFIGIPFYTEDPEFTASDISRFLNTVLLDEPADKEDAVRIVIIPCEDYPFIALGTDHKDKDRPFPHLIIRPKGRCWVQETAYDQPTSEQIEVVDGYDYHNPTFFSSEEFDLCAEGYAYTEKNAKLLAGILRECERKIRKEEGR